MTEENCWIWDHGAIEAKVHLIVKVGVLCFVPLAGDLCIPDIASR